VCVCVLEVFYIDVLVVQHRRNTTVSYLVRVPGMDFNPFYLIKERSKSKADTFIKNKT